MENKSIGKSLSETLFDCKKNGGLLLSDAEIKNAFDYCEDYKKYLDKAKTEREAVLYSLELLKGKGFKEYDKGISYKAGDKIYYVNRDKCITACVIGKDDISEGINLLAAHIDSPRLDLKQRPLYEENEIALFKTHYYGGIKKYQWTAMPLSLHGVVILKNGEKITVSLGEKDDEPVFCITDLLPHLAAEQMKKTLDEAINGEGLNVLVGALPFKDDEVSEKVKLNIMKLLNEKYGMVEADFLSAELEMVPAFKAKDIGFDRAVIGGYGQDDRVCAYTALSAVLECECPQKTVMVVLSDKEEIGSEGNTGLNSYYLKYFIKDLADSFGASITTVLTNTKCLSADVNVAFDPNYPDVCDRKNAAYFNNGVVISKYTGARGKYDTSDCSAEFMGYIRKLFDGEGVLWQTAELGKVDLGGGGTVAKYLAKLNMDVVDVGVPVMSMHSPFELTSKIDVYMAYLAFKAFIK